jgi:hypothetical protein
MGNAAGDALDGKDALNNGLKSSASPTKPLSLSRHLRYIARPSPHAQGFPQNIRLSDE